jgi:GNAT superfamily N-acetyltransferase
MAMAAAAASAVRVRAATLQDVASIRNLLQQLGYDVSEVEVARRVGLLERERNHLLLVAADDSDKPLAVLHAFRRDALEKSPQVTVQSLVVDASARRLGTAKLLMKAVEDWAITQGVPEVGLSTRIDRAEAHAFYEAIGYARVSAAHLYAKTPGRP